MTRFGVSTTAPSGLDSSPCGLFDPGPIEDLVRAECARDASNRDEPALIELVRHAPLATEPQATSELLLRLLTTLAGAASTTDACQRLADEIRSQFSCEHVFVGLAKPGGRCCTLTAAAGSIGVDRTTDLARACDTALSETLAAPGVRAWARDDAAESAGGAARRQLAQLTRVDAIIAAPLFGPDGKPVGSCLLLGPATLANDVRLKQFLAASSGSVGACLALLERATESVSRRTWRACSSRAARVRWWGLAGVVALAVISPWIPWTYHIKCACSVEPVTRRSVAAPFNGQFAKSFVKPGDVVRRDQVLAQMDGRDLRIEAAGLQAELERAAKDHDVHLAAGKVAAAQVAKLEWERLDQKRRLLESRAEHLEIKSPLDGVVIRGDLQRAEGVSVTVGHPLFEIAPLDQMVFELAIPDDDISHVRAGQEVEVQVEGLAGSRFRGTLAAIHPRAEIRDGSNVFLGEVVLENARQLLRPGMKGHAQIRGPQKSVPWVVFHKPWSKLLAWLPW